MAKAIIRKVKSGKNKGQFKFKLTADNGEPLSENEAYNNEQDLRAMLTKYFPGFTIVEKL